jgi:hypothetical protein
MTARLRPSTFAAVSLLRRAEVSGTVGTKAGAKCSVNVPRHASVAPPGGRRLQQLPICVVNIFAPKDKSYFVDPVLSREEISRGF